MAVMQNLGFIPAWEFDMDPANNPQVVDMAFPPGMTQTTVQPVGPYYSGSGMQGLGAASLVGDLTSFITGGAPASAYVLVLAGIAAGWFGHKRYGKRFDKR